MKRSVLTECVFTHLPRVGGCVVAGPGGRATYKTERQRLVFALYQSGGRATELTTVQGTFIFISEQHTHTVAIALPQENRLHHFKSIFRQDKSFFYESGVDLGGIPLSRAPHIPLSRAPQIFRRNTIFAGTVIRPDYQLLPRFGARF